MTRVGRRRNLKHDLNKEGEMQIRGVKKKEVQIEISDIDARNFVLNFIKDKFKITTKHRIVAGALVVAHSERWGPHDCEEINIIREATKEDAIMVGAVELICKQGG